MYSIILFLMGIQVVSVFYCNQQCCQWELFIVHFPLHDCKFLRLQYGFISSICGILIYGRWLSGDVEANASEKKIFITYILVREACHAMHGLMENTRFGQETDGMREGMAQKLDCIFCKKGKGKSLGLTDLNGVSRLWPIGGLKVSGT